MTVTPQTLQRLAGRISVAFATLFLCAAGDIPANRRALDEASSFLSDACQIANPDEAKACRGLQEIFLMNYLRAMAGKTLSMKNLAAAFSSPEYGVNTVSKVRSCAWAMIAAFASNPPEYGTTTDGIVDVYCAGLGNNDFVAAKHIAAVTSESIARSPARLPRQADGDTWPGDGCDGFDMELAARGQFAPPHCPPGPADRAKSK